MTTDLDALRALDAKRVQGEYYVHTDAAWIPDDKCEGISCKQPDGTSATIVVTETGHYPPDMATAQWLAAISNAGPGLIDEVEQLRTSLAKMNRRAQAAESVVRRTGIIDDIETIEPSRLLDVFTTRAVALYHDQARAQRAEIERLRTSLAEAEHNVRALRAECARLGAAACDAKWDLMP